MLPIADTIRSRSFPLVNWILIAVNALAFFYETSLSPDQLLSFITTYALIPAQIDLAQPLSLVPFLTHQFLHADWLHFLSNMWILFIFGDNVEDRLGPIRYLIFYLLGGVAAGALQVYLATDPTLPALGASGAIAAVLGGYFVFFPTARVITLIPIFLFPWFVRVPALIYLGLWFLLQFLQGVTSLVPGAPATNIAWWAHIGGFLFGLVLARPLCARRCAPRRYWADEYYPW
ncbi:MAG TPA: rhomboid family intramembrane serine protease [Anaerolineaceae bacterium]|nr:rhomboid family intramembrane serine protease [Anaerolineaceae bacterium]